MLKFIYLCEYCDKEIGYSSAQELPEGWIKIASDNNSLTIECKVENSRLKTMEGHRDIHFCSKECLIDFFFTIQ